MDAYIISINGRWHLVSKKGIEPLKIDKSYKVHNTRAKGRTIAQNSALHLYWSMLANALNDAGYDVEMTLSKSKGTLIKKVFDWGREKISNHNALSKMEDRLMDDLRGKVPWTMVLVKEILWKPLQAKILGKESTTELSKDEDITKMYLSFDAIISDRTGVSVAFPSVENMLLERNYN